MSATEEKNVTIEEVEDEMPELEDAVQQPAGAPGMDELQQQAAQTPASRLDNKTRKAFARMGLQPYGEAVHRVTIRQGRTTFSISQPEVFKGSGETYVVIGEPQLDDSSASQRAAIQQLLQQQQFLSQQQQQQQQETTDASAAGEEAAAEDITAEGSAAEEDIDESQVQEDDINLVLASAPQGTTRAQAVKALLEKGNPVDAVLHLSTE